MSDNVTTKDNYESASNREDKLAEFEVSKRGLIGNVQHWLHQTPAAVPLIVLIASILIFGVLIGDRFFSPFALTLVLQQVQIVGIVAAAQSLVILTAGIDLSVGAITVFSSVIMGQFAFRYGLPPSVAVVCGLIFGTLCGALNGFLVARIKLPPFIVTLGTWQIILASNYMDIKSLLHLGCAKIATFIKGKSPEEIKKILGGGADVNSRRLLEAMSKF